MAFKQKDFPKVMTSEENQRYASVFIVKTIKFHPVFCKVETK